MFTRDRVADFPIQVMCELPGVSRGGYHAWASRDGRARAAADQVLAAEIRAARAASRGCRANAPMESFFATLKGELVEAAGYQTRDHARADVFQYTDGFYSKRRLHSALGDIAPEQKAEAFRSAATAAQSCPQKRGKPSKRSGWTCTPMRSA